MTNKLWVAKISNKKIHLEYNKRVPRKKKKFIKDIFKLAGDASGDIVLVSPRLIDVLNGLKIKLGK